MTALFKSKDECKMLQQSLESVQRVAGEPPNREVILASLSGAERQHAAGCASCSGAIEELLELRGLVVAALPAGEGPRAGFTGRVMAAIAAKQRELEEKELIWTSLPRLASRFAAVCMVVLFVAGAWLFTAQRRNSLASTQPKQRQESIFDGNSGSSDLNDEVMASTAEDRR